MTHYQFWNALNVAIDKDGYGGSFDPTDYEDIARIVNLSFFKRKMEELYKNLKPGQDIVSVIYSSKIFRNLITRETIVPVAGVINLSTGLTATYGYWMTMRDSTSNVKIRLIQNEDLDEVLDNAILAPSTSYPVATIDGNNCRINPTSITGVIFVFLKKPTDPIFDYYSDSNDNIVYMTAGATNVSIPSGATYSDGTAGPTTKNSRTFEFLYDSSFHPEIFQEMLTLLSARLREQQLEAYSERQQIKQDSI